MSNIKVLRAPDGTVIRVIPPAKGLPGMAGWPSPEWLNSQDGGQNRTWAWLRANTLKARITPNHDSTKSHATIWLV
jgi:hypothetical protein